jgi:DNA-binding transcriptional LysR family regulator
LKRLSEDCPDVEVLLKHGTSLEILAGIRNGSLDAGFYNEPGAPDPDLMAVEVSQFKIYLAARPGLVADPAALDWPQLADIPWIYPTTSACCGQTAESLFKLHRIRPRRVISLDREDVTRKLIADGIGVGLLHADTAKAAQLHGEVELLLEAPGVIRILFAHLASRAQDPLLTAATALLQAASSA